jgi:hypothetical protein
MEDEIQLADVLKPLVQGFHKHLDEVKDAELRLGGVHREDEIEGGVVAVDELGIASAKQATHAHTFSMERPWKGLLR